MSAPTLKPKLKRDGADAYVGQFDAARLSARPFRVERDGDEWVTADKHPQWFATLNDVRAYIALVNVGRWASTREPEARAFVRWAQDRLGPRCRGVRRMEIPGLGSSNVHDGCCHWLLSRPLPEGVTILDLYREWSADRG